MEFSTEKAQETGINFAAFNQSSTRFTLATKAGFVIYSIHPSVEKYYEDHDGCSRSNVEMFEDTALIGLVGTGEDSSVSQRKVVLYNMQSDENICSFNYPTAVISLKFSKDRLVFILENEIHILDSERLSEKAFVISTMNNPKGICALSSNGHLIAYPRPNPDRSEKGSVALFHCKHQESYGIPIQAHTNPIAALALNASGDLLATASTKGTSIRVFRLPGCTEEFFFHRGSYPAEITSLSFSEDSSLLCVSSDKPTIHIFPLRKAKPSEGSIFSAYIPSVVSGIWDDHPRIRLTSSCRSISAIGKNNRSVYVITEDGQFFIYDLDLATGGSVCETPSSRSSISLDSFTQSAFL